MNADDIRKKLKGDGEIYGKANPYAVEVTAEEYRNDILSENPTLGLVKCRDCKCYVDIKNSVEHPEDYVCLWCEEQTIRNDKS